MRSYKLTYLFAGILLFIFYYSCKKDTTKTIDFKYGYFPIDTGHYVIYNVDSITYNSFYNPVRIDTVQFQIKEVIQTIFPDNTGYPTCRIEGYRRSNSNAQWGAQPYYVWTSDRYTTTAQKTENNLRFIKLIFPPTLNTSWAGNSYIDCVDTSAFLAGWTYTYQNIDVPLNITTSSGTLSFDSSLTIIQVADSNLISKLYSVEKYAKNAGLVYKQLVNLAVNDTIIPNPSIPWPQRASDGYIYTMTAVSYNK
jgi:hypothetical protein